MPPSLWLGVTGVSVPQWERGLRHGFGVQSLVPEAEVGYHNRLGTGGVGTLYRIETYDTLCCAALLVSLVALCRCCHRRR
jgi:hypothetical protein